MQCDICHGSYFVAVWKLERRPPPMRLGWSSDPNSTIFSIETEKNPQKNNKYSNKKVFF